MEATRLCQSNNLLQQLIEKVKDKSDILSRAVAVQTLSALAHTEHGYKWLSEIDVMSDLIGALEDDDPLAGLILPGMCSHSILS